MLDTVTSELTHLISLRLLKAFQAACHKLIGKLPSESELLQRICNAAAEHGGFSMAWAGYANNDPNKSIIPMAYHGNRQDVRYLLTKKRSWSDETVIGQGPIGRTLREGLPIIVADIGEDPVAGPWMPEAQELGYRGVIFLPFVDGDKAFGFLGLYSRQARPVDISEAILLQEIVTGITLEIMRLRKQEEAGKIKEATLKIAVSLSTQTGANFFTTFIRNVTSAFNADAGIIARICPDQPAYAQTLVAIVDGGMVDNFRYPIDETPCREMLNAHDCVIAANVSSLYPGSTQLHAMHAEAYVGTQLYQPDGKVMGFIYLIFRIPLKHTAHIKSTLHIFAHSASLELLKLPR